MPLETEVQNITLAFRTLYHMAYWIVPIIFGMLLVGELCRQFQGGVYGRNRNKR